jgi:NAD(P)-dependent dehydrogenase (short-subunit alcohol dehydrogenase family)
MTSELDGKVAIVTGGASGIGRGTVETFLAEGAKVVIADIDREAGEAMAASCGSDAGFTQTDVSDGEQVRELVSSTVEKFGGLHIMFNNAGISGIRHERLLDEDFADFHRVIDINLLGVMVCTREAARHMSTNGGGSIINVSSIGGMQPGKGPWAYHVSKAAVVMFTQSAALDLGEYGIRVNCIAPANIETPILGAMLSRGLPDDVAADLMKEIRQYLIGRQPLHRQGKPSDIGEAAVFFGSDRSSYITGAVVPVDGGLLTGDPNPNNEMAQILQRARARASA